MKFGKYLASRQLQLPEYSGHFIDYKALKKLIKQLAIPTRDEANPATQLEIQQRLQENKASFFFRVERELDKVNSFYLEKQANLAINLNLLIMKKDELLRYDQHQGPNGQVALRNSISYLNLYQNFKKIHQDLIRLQQFIELNETGFSKVVKKWDKRSKSHTKELFIQTAVSVQPVFHKNEINELSDLVTLSLFYLESIMDGDFSSLAYSVQPVTSAVPATATIGKDIDLPMPEDSTVPLSKPDLTIVTTPTTTHRPSIINLQNNEIDELYSSFVNIATTKDLDLSLLSRWIDKVLKNSESSNTSSNVTEPAKFDPSVISKLSKIFLLSISNLKISDTFLESFLKLIDYQIDFTYVSDDFNNNNKNVIQECCSIPPPPSQSTSESHVVINNGVKVINSSDSINHSRTFIVEYIMKNLSADSTKDLLICKDFNGRSGLHYASQNNRLDLLEIILPNFPKLHLDDLDNDSMSPLLLAIKQGNFTVIQKLVQSGSNCFPKSEESKLQYLPINFTCKFGDYKTLEYLLSHATSKELINQQDVEGLLPIHVVSRSGHYKLIKLLIQYGADLNKTDGLNKWTPIFYSSLEGHVKTTQELVRYGAKVDLVDQDGYNVLYYCVIEGHIEVLNELLKYSNTILTKKNRENEVKLLASAKSSPIARDTTIPSILDNDYDSEDSGNTNKDINVDNIPDFKLPPPILPMRRYGHNFLEQKVLIELIFPPDSQFVHLFDSTISDLKPGRLTLTSNITDIVPRNILLPLSQDTNSTYNCVFQTEVDSLNDFRIDFEIFPKFGTRLIAKTTALSFSQIDTSSPEINSIQLPLFDLRLRNIGELKFNYQIIFPFSGTLLETSKFDTYWKSSTCFVKNRQTLKLNAAGGLSPNNFLSPSLVNGATNGTTSNNGASAIPASESSASSVVTATSLSGEYLRIKICLLNDGTPIVCPHWSISITEDIDLYLPNLSLEQLSSITNNLFDYQKVIHDLSRMTYKDIGLIKKLLRIIFLPLDILLEVLSVDINLNLELMFPSLYELENLPFIGNIQLNLNNFIDFTLTDVFNHIRNSKKNPVGTNGSIAPGNGGRSIIFLSSNSLICKILNWKQPNFPVFLIMNGITYNSSKRLFESRTTNGLLLDDIKKKSNVVEVLNKNAVDTNYQEVTIRSIKEAVEFTISNNLIGLITSIHLLDLVPKLIPLIRSRGLVLVASSDLNDDNDNDEMISKDLDSYTRTEINGLRFDDVLSFKEDITM
ncbi:SPX-domain-containing protein [Suhomyces tanzawaensis NRRL Y-17324]|uniref:SPX-domain-containing protein n=1 Tax=Suhomyces tanzawaensis NRRL Y-17324 TaxID=984487 RepID=A0A1E4SF75_9ASCO|nr:SPX-domain-containing protein [Suhomyces tanzawaensis NRRL Y-17324]ODV78171.1 SPX-domain-containing protein [Suhomyces tanzawaensis NRRL Y-17324]